VIVPFKVRVEVETDVGGEVVTVEIPVTMYDRAEGSVHPGPLLKLRVFVRKTQAYMLK